MASCCHHCTITCRVSSFFSELLSIPNRALCTVDSQHIAQWCQGTLCQKVFNDWDRVRTLERHLQSCGADPKGRL